MQLGISRSEKQDPRFVGNVSSCQHMYGADGIKSDALQARSGTPKARLGRYQASSYGNEASSGSFPAALLSLWRPTQPTSSFSESSECVCVRRQPECEASRCCGQL